jgi:NitT/TauT family transport system ATP-binding protein
MTLLQLSSISHAYLGRIVIEHISLAISAGEIAVLVGPSGCGKSTVMHAAAGLIEARDGRVERSYHRHAMVFQDPRLMPWLTALDNIALPLHLRGIRRKNRHAAARQMAESVSLAVTDLDKYPSELSGGMRQRAAIARALIGEPDFIYFDEPFTALDVALKRRMQDLVIAAAARSSFAALFVTHDLNEAVRLGNRILVMDANGRGIAGSRTLPGTPGDRSDAEIFALVDSFTREDPLFRQIHDVDERRTA